MRQCSGMSPEREASVVVLRCYPEKSGKDHATASNASDPADSCVEPFGHPNFRRADEQASSNQHADKHPPDDQLATRHLNAFHH